MNCNDAPSAPTTRMLPYWAHLLGSMSRARGELMSLYALSPNVARALPQSARKRSEHCNSTTVADGAELAGAHAGRERTQELVRESSVGCDARLGTEQ